MSKIDSNFDFGKALKALQAGKSLTVQGAILTPYN